MDDIDANRCDESTLLSLQPSFVNYIDNVPAAPTATPIGSPLTMLVVSAGLVALAARRRG